MRTCERTGFRPKTHFFLWLTRAIIITRDKREPNKSFVKPSNGRRSVHRKVDGPNVDESMIFSVRNEKIAFKVISMFVFERLTFVSFMAFVALTVPAQTTIVIISSSSPSSQPRRSQRFKCYFPWHSTISFGVIRRPNDVWGGYQSDITLRKNKTKEII